MLYWSCNHVIVIHSQKMDTDFLKRLAINLLSTSVKSQKWNSAKCNLLEFILVATRKNL